MFVCVLPSTVQSSIAFTSIARGNVPAALCSASVSNLLGMVLTPLLVAALLATHGSGFSLKALADIAVELLLPFGLGQLLPPLGRAWITRQKHVLSYVDRGSDLLVVYSAFSESVVAGVWTHMDPWSLVLVFALDAVLLALVLALTTAASRAFGFSKEDESPSCSAARRRVSRPAYPWRTSVSRHGGGGRGAAADDLPPDPALRLRDPWRSATRGGRSRRRRCRRPTSSGREGRRPATDQ